MAFPLDSKTIRPGRVVRQSVSASNGLSRPVFNFYLDNDTCKEQINCLLHLFHMWMFLLLQMPCFILTADGVAIVHIIMEVEVPHFIISILNFWIMMECDQCYEKQTFLWCFFLLHEHTFKLLFYYCSKKVKWRYQ